MTACAYGVGVALAVVVQVAKAKELKHKSAVLNLKILEALRLVILIDFRQRWSYVLLLIFLLN